MGWTRRSKLAFDTIRRFASKIVPKSQIPESISRINQPNSSVPILNKIRISGFSLTSPTSKNLGFQFGSKQNSFSLSLGLRHYYVDRYQVRHFRPRGPRKWFQNPRYLFIVTVVGSAVVITVYYGNLETIPYTKRTHFVLLSPSLDKQIGDAQFKQIKAGFKGKILPAIHPDSIRVRLIAKDIIGALQRGLKKEEVWTDLDYASEPHESGGYEALVALTQSSEGKWHKEDEVLDDKWVQQSRKKGQERRVQSSTAHLEGLNWEILVVNEPVVNAFCLPGGKIVVFTGLLDHFKTDEEIATIIGHEVYDEFCFLNLVDIVPTLAKVCSVTSV